jgi:drug/metabolite transporter (DMT)-like permease
LVAIAYVTFFAALAVAPMGVASALASVSEAVAPVVIALVWKGESLGLLGWVGIVVAVGGALAVGLAQGYDGKVSALAAILAIVSGLGFGLSIVVLDVVPEHSGLVPPAIEALVELVLLALLLAAVVRWRAVRRGMERIGLVTAPEPAGVPTGSSPGLSFGVSPAGRPTPEDQSRAATVGRTSGRGLRHVVLPGVGGLLQGLATVVLMYALWSGSLAVVGVVTCLYPVATAVLARVVLREKLHPMQITGIAVALAGCVILALA